jgi:hypothetical protein
VTHQVIARDLLAVLCALQALATVAIDLNGNHARSAEWTGHARFHVVWQTTAFAALAVVEILLLFLSGPSARQRFYLAALLAAIPMIGFFVAFLGRELYGGLFGRRQRNATVKDSSTELQSGGGSEPGGGDCGFSDSDPDRGIIPVPVNPSLEPAMTDESRGRRPFHFGQ